MLHGLSSSVASGSYFLVVVNRLLIAVGPLVVEAWALGCEVSVVVVPRL